MRKLSSFRTAQLSPGGELYEQLPPHLRQFDVDELGCWIAHRRRTNGYSWATSAVHNGVRVKGSAYRLAYLFLVGPLPELPLELEHVCCRGADGCMNPFHLRPTTHLENMQRGGHRGRTHCPQGHPLAGDNLMTYGPGGRWRGCRTCRRETNIRLRAKYPATCTEPGCDRNSHNRGLCWSHYQKADKQPHKGKPRTVSNAVEKLLRERGPLTAIEVAEILGLTRYQAHQALHRLQRRGVANALKYGRPQRWAA